MLRRHFPSLVGGLVLLPLVVAEGAAGEDEATGASFGLKYQAIEDWNIILPRERWTSFTDEIPIAHADGDGFAVERAGLLAIEVDTNADGEVDAKVRGGTGFLKLRGRNDEGETFNYAVRFEGDGKSWKFASSGAMVGKLDGTLVRVIDQDNNGSYDDYGVDAMIVGKGNAASLLSRVVNAGGKLHELEISRDGTRATFRPYAGQTAVLNATSRYASNGKLIAAVVSCVENEYHFNAAGTKSLTVPAGTYELSSGYVKRAGESVHVRTGKMPAFELRPGTERVLEWGGPVVAEFDYEVEEETITVAPQVAFYGRAGEEYHSFWPEAKSPKIIVTDKRTRKELTSGRFGGC